jgi:hypothetical protein
METYLGYRRVSANTATIGTREETSMSVEDHAGPLASIATTTFMGDLIVGTPSAVRSRDAALYSWASQRSELCLKVRGFDSART